MKDFWKGVLVGGLISGDGKRGESRSTFSVGGAIFVFFGGLIVVGLAYAYVNNDVLELLPDWRAGQISYMDEPYSGYYHLMESLASCQRDAANSHPAVTLERFPRLDRGPFQVYAIIESNSCYLLEFKHQWCGWRLWRRTLWSLFDGNKMDPGISDPYGDYHPRYVKDLIASGDTSYDQKELNPFGQDLYDALPPAKVAFTLQPGDPGYQANPPVHHYDMATGKVEDGPEPPPDDSAEFENLTDVDGVVGKYRAIEMSSSEVCASFGCSSPPQITDGIPIYNSRKDDLVVFFKLVGGQVHAISYADYSYGWMESIKYTEIRQCLRDNAEGLRWKKNSELTGGNSDISDAWDRSDGRVQAIVRYDKVAGLSRLIIYILGENSPSAPNPP